MQSVLATAAYAQEASSSANNIALPSVTASSSGTLGTNPATTSGATFPDTPNPFSDSGSFDTQNAASQAVSSLLDSSLGNNQPAGSAFVKQKSVIHALSKKSFKSDESVAVSIGNATADTVALSVTDFQGKAIDPDLIEKTTVDTQTTVTIHPPSFGFRPGKYTIHIVDSDGTSSTQDFTWGVLAINTDKSMYLPNETSQMSIAVLDEKGNMVCDANVNLEVTDPSGSKTLLSTATKTIIVNPQCQSHAVSLTPDYAASYQVHQTGQYTLSLSATTKNGTNTIADSLSVANSVPFDVSRSSATRIYPANTYPMIFHIKANQDFTGTISDYAPANFTITPYATGSAKTYDSSSLIAPALNMSEAFGVDTLSLGRPFNGEFTQTQGFGVALTDPKEKALYAAFGLAGHDGLDFALPEGTSVLAADDGTVSLAGEGAYGTTVVIDHAWGRSYYGHLSTLKVKVGDTVTKGQEIALSGNTGLSTGAHLHFGIKPMHPNMQNGFYGKVDPTPYFTFLSQSSNVLGASTTTSADQSHKVISWNVSLKKGESIDLSYSYKAPEISPQLYSLGPLTFKEKGNANVFQELRKWQIAVDAAPTSVFTDGSSTAILTSATTLVSQATSFADSNNVIIAVCTFNNTGTVKTIAAGGLILQNGSTTLASNANIIQTGNTSSRATVSYTFVYSDSGVTASPTYNIKATANATGLNGECKIEVIHGLASPAFTDGTNYTSLPTSDTTLASATMTNAGDNVIITAIQIYNTASGSRTVPAGAAKITNGSGSTLASNQYVVDVQSNTSGNLFSDGVLLIARDAGAAANSTYNAVASAPSNNVNAQARILVLNGVDSIFTDGTSTALSNSSDTTVASVATSFAAGTNVIIAGNQIDNHTATTTIGVNATFQDVKNGSTVLTSNPFNILLGATGGVVESRGSGSMANDSGASANPTYNLTDRATTASSINGEAKLVALSLAAPAYTQTSNRFFNNPSGSGNVTMQSGTATIANGSTTGTATLGTAVDSAKSFLTFSVKADSTNWTPTCGQIMGDFTSYGSSQTALTFTRQGTSCTNAINIEYYVATFGSGVTVQRGIATTTSATSTNVTLSPSVDTTKSFPLINLETDGASYDGNDWVIPTLTNLTGNNASTLNLATNSSSGTLSEVAWQVVTYTSASVQAGTATIAGASSSTTASISSVTTGKSWLVYYSNYNAAGSGNAADESVEGKFNSSTQLSFARGSTGATSVSLQYFVVSFTDNSTVQSGNISLSAGATSGTGTITTVDTTASLPVAGGLYGRGGQSSNTTNSDTYNAQGTVDLTNSTTVTFTRGITESATASLTYFIVTFSPSTAYDVGAPLAAANTAITLSSASQTFRLRMDVNVANNQLGQSGENFKLQYVEQGSGTCAAPSGGTPASYTDVTGSTLIAYNVQGTLTNGTALVANANDPTDGGNTINDQVYIDSNNFTNSVVWIPKGQDGMWDFSLIDNTGGNGKTYCFRAVLSSGTAFGSYTNYPSITLATSGPTNDQLMRHGKWFNNGVEQPFTF